MLYLKPKLALILFLNVDMAEIKRWLRRTRRMLRQHLHCRLSAEELCRWEAESHFLVD